MIALPDASHSVEVPVSIQDAWSFASDMDKWMPLMPGYIEHELLSGSEALWTFKGDLGFTKKIIKLKIDITGRTEPSRLSFQIDGVSDSVGGEGYFEASALGDGLTRLTGHLDISGKGAMGFMMNGVMKTFVPQTVEELTQAVAAKLVESPPIPS